MCINLSAGWYGSVFFIIIKKKQAVGWLLTGH
jgi:hypothetical protein